MISDSDLTDMKSQKNFNVQVYLYLDDKSFLSFVTGYNRGEYFPRNQPRLVMSESTDNLSNIKIRAILFNNITSAISIAVDRHSCEKNADHSHENAPTSLLCTQFLS